MCKTNVYFWGDTRNMCIVMCPRYEGKCSQQIQLIVLGKRLIFRRHVTCLCAFCWLDYPWVRHGYPLRVSPWKSNYRVTRLAVAQYTASESATAD